MKNINIVQCPVKDTHMGLGELKNIDKKTGKLNMQADEEKKATLR